MDELDFGATLKGFSPGQKIFQRYVLKKILGRGGMGLVWLAVDGELEREVAMKFLPEVVALDAEALADLKRETRRNLDLTYANIVRIYDFVADSRTAAISMEYVDGATLGALKLAKPGRIFTIEDVRPWLGQLVDALTYAHTRAKVVHRDLKPANLMLTAEGELKITDFGIARGISDSVSRVSAQAGTSGTPLYMSPQQMLGEKPAVTDDIYSLGATLFELLTGKPPFYSGNVVLQVQTKVAPSIAERRQELDVVGEAIPPHWEKTIAACLAKDPQARPQSVAELGQRLGLTGNPVISVSAAPNQPATAAPEPKSVAVAPPGLRRRGLALAGSAVSLALLGSGMILVWIKAGQDYSDQQWSDWWRWIEYPVLGVWIALSLGLIRWSLGREFAWRSWLPCGVALFAADVAFSEAITAAMEVSRSDEYYLALPSLLGVFAGGVGMFAFRHSQPLSLTRAAISLAIGWGCGAFATVCAKVPILPEALDSTLARISFPVWVVMGTMTWLFFLRFMVVQTSPKPPVAAGKAGVVRTALTAVALSLLVFAVIAASNLLWLL